MKAIFISLAAVLALASCSKDNSTSDHLVSSSSNEAVMGAYSGEFTRTGIADTGYLMIDLDIIKYRGSSRDAGFPGICGGVYSYKGSTITFDDTCYAGNGIMLEGTYNIEKDDNNLHIWRTSANVTDDYRLHRLFR